MKYDIILYYINGTWGKLGGVDSSSLKLFFDWFINQDEPISVDTYNMSVLLKPGSIFKFMVEII